MLTVLRRRNVALLTFGHLISVVGSWLLLIALPFVIYQRTGSALAAGSMFLIEMVPALLFGSLAGVFVDRWDRRRTMIVADVLRAVILLPLLLATQDGWLWVVYPVAFLEATITQFFLPARGALLPRLVPDEELEGANAALSVGEEFALLTGSVLGGALIGFVGIGGLALLDAATYVLSAVAIALIAVPVLAPGEGETATVTVARVEVTTGMTPLRSAFVVRRGLERVDRRTAAGARQPRGDGPLCRPCPGHDRRRGALRPQHCLH